MLNVVRTRGGAGSASRFPPPKPLRAGVTVSTSTSSTRGRSPARPSARSTPSEPRRLRALLFARGVPRRTTGEIYRGPLRPRGERAARPGPLLSPDDGLRPQHDPYRRGGHRRPAGIRRVVSGSTRAGSSPALSFRLGGAVMKRAEPHFRWCRARAAGSTTSRRSGSGESGLPRRPEEVVVEAPTRSPLALERRLPARVHLRCERQQRLLRAGVARPLSPRVRKDTSNPPPVDARFTPDRPPASGGRFEG